MKHYYLIPEFGQGFGGIGIFYKHLIENTPIEQNVVVFTVFSDCRECNGRKVFHLFRSDAYQNERIKTALYAMGHVFMSILAVVVSLRTVRSQVTLEATDFRCLAWLLFLIGQGDNIIIRTHGTARKIGKRPIYWFLSPVHLVQAYYRGAEYISRSKAVNVIFISNYMEDREFIKYPILKRKSLIFNPFTPLPVATGTRFSSCRHIEGQHCRPITALYFGTLSIGKGIKDLQTLRQSLRGSIVLIACGRVTDDARQHLNGIDYRGLVSRAELRELSKSCDLIVLPMKDEPFGLTTLEAISLKKPILYLRSGALPELLQNYAAALAYKEMSEVTLGEIWRIIEDCKKDSSKFDFDYAEYEVKKCVEESYTFYRSVLLGI